MTDRVPGKGELTATGLSARSTWFVRTACAGTGRRARVTWYGLFLSFLFLPPFITDNGHIEMDSTAAQTGSVSDRPLAGIAFMAAAAVLYSSFDALTKWLVADYSPFEILFFRALFAFLPWALWVAREPFPVRVARTPEPGLQVLRAVLGFSSVTCFALAFRVLPLAVAVAIVYSAPLYTTALARPVLGELVGRTRWLAVVFGFVGVLVITRPSPTGLQAGAAWAVLGSILYAFTSLATRRLGSANRAPTTMFYSMTVYVLLGAMLLPFTWKTPDAAHWAGFVGIGIVGGTAQFLLFEAYRHAPAATVSPFEYTTLAWSVVWGFLVWQELPDADSVLGMLIIAAAGLALARYEHRLQRRPPIAHATD